MVRLGAALDDVPAAVRLAMPDPATLIEQAGAELEAEYKQRAADWRAATIAHLPPRFRATGFTTFPNRKAMHYRAVRGWLKTPASERRPGLFISGPAGVGKTGLAAAAYFALMVELGERIEYRASADAVGWFVFEGDLLRMLREDTLVAGEAGHEARGRAVDVLVIDDLGRTSLTDWRYSALFALINARYEGLKPTLITSNLALDDWEDAALAGRIAELCDVINVPKDAADLRHG